MGFFKDIFGGNESSGPSPAEIARRQEAAREKERERIRLEQQQREAEKQQQRDAEKANAAKAFAAKESRRKSLVSSLATLEDEEDDSRKRFLKAK